MIKDILFQIKHLFSNFTFNKKKQTEERLTSSFGKLKDDDFNFENIEKYFRNKDNSEAYQVLSDKTCNDLDFDDLFTYLDRTHSKVGQQYFYNNLRVLEDDKERTLLNEKIISDLSNNVELRLSLQKQLDQLNYKDAYEICTLFQDKHVEPPKWFNAIKILSFTSLTVLILGFFNPIFFLVLIGLFCVNFILHYWNKNNIVKYVNSIPQL